MKRTARILLWTLGSVVAVIMTLCGIVYLANWKNMRQESLDQRRCDARLAELKHDLPVGTSREAVLAYLHVHTASVVHFADEGDTLSVDIGRVRSASWVCNFFENYAELSFTSNTSTAPDQRSLNSIETRSIGQCL
jgi:hypothetical protein